VRLPRFSGPAGNSAERGFVGRFARHGVAFSEALRTPPQRLTAPVSFFRQRLLNATIQEKIGVGGLAWATEYQVVDVRTV
jgi:hypothetical protein